VRDDADIKDLVRMIAKEIDSHKRDACGNGGVKFFKIILNPN
ncbi:MAG: hypothetical protein RLZZ46_1552, partial [Bacteroidota bacterium]